MKDAKLAKLASWLGDEAQAAALTEAGLDTPAKVKAADEAVLDAALGKNKGKKVRGFKSVKK